MRPRQPANFTVDGTNFRKASAGGTATVIQNVVAENLLLKMVETLLGHQTSFGLILGIRLDDFFFQVVDRGITGALFLARSVERGAQSFGIVPVDFSQHLFVEHWRFDRSFFDAERFVKLFL